MEKKKTLSAALTILLLLSVLAMGLPMVADSSSNATDAEPAGYTIYQADYDAGNAVVAGNFIEDRSAVSVKASSSTSHILDQAQERINYGFLIDDTAIRWQEFRPTLASLAEIDLYIRKDGDPGNLIVAVKDEAGDVLWDATIAGAEIEGWGWVEIPVDPLVSLQPDRSYNITVSSDTTASRGNKYFWQGQTESDYDRGISSVESGWPEYDFAFRTWAGEEKPDLVITDVWTENSTICYQIRNIGKGVASEDHCTLLSIDDKEQEDFINQDLEPGERLKRCFDYGWDCSPPDDVIEVCADYTEDVIESDETNNCREESWKCDTTPPRIISGPTVSEIGQTSVMVSWTTDEDSNSMVKFGGHAGEYEDQEEEGTLLEEHEVTLTDLTPSTTYHYVVESADASENVVVSKEGFFETAPPSDAESPTMSSLTLSRVEGPFQFYKMTAPVFDNIGVEKVEFYLDDELIGVDYSGSAEEIPGYNAYLDPAGMGMTREDLFKSHDLRAVAFDKSGLTTVIEEIGVPSFEPPNGELEILSPPPDYTLFFEDSVVPEGTSLDIEVYASEYEYDCLLGGSVPLPLLSYPEAVGQVSTPNDDDDFSLFDRVPVYEFPYEPPWCHEVGRAVLKVEFYIDIDGDRHAEWVHTWIPSSDDDLTYTYSWDVGGLGPRSYYTVVKAYLSDDRELYANRYINIAREGISLNREVVRYENFYQVSLEVVNEGTFSIQLDEIMDNLTSFQAIRRQGDDFDLTTHYSINTQQCLVTIDFFSDSSDTITLGPAESKTVVYFAVPIHQASYVAGFGIGADEVKVHYVDRGAFVEEGFDRYVNPHLPPLSLNEAIRTSDYLIVTNPQRLFYLYSASEVHKLLSTMAELARWKNGILGYLSVPPGGDVDFSPMNPFDVDEKIEYWGACMKGSDGTPSGYLSNGYLLLVGEVEIVPAVTVYGFSVDWSNDGTTTYVPLTDLAYANTAGSPLCPELAVGRVIGDSAHRLEWPLDASLGVYNDEPGYEFDRDNILLYGGDGCCCHDHMNTLDRIEEILTSEFFVLSIREPDIPDEATRISAFQTAVAAGQDVIYFIAHGSFSSCGSIRRQDVYDTTLGDHAPFVFGASCNTGNYEVGDDYSFAETFLDKGAAVYLGSTQVSSVSKNCWAGRNMFANFWLPETSVGEAVRHLKQSVDHGSPYTRLWIWEYNLYGDPKFGAVPAGSTGYPAESLSSPTSTLELEVPDYEVYTREGIDYVEIPGGGLTDAEGKPEVPTWSTQVDYPAGCEVQDVTLSERSGLVVTTGLQVPTAYSGTNCGDTLPARAESTHQGWFPEKSYSWDITRHPDGGSTLSIVVYPFYYNPETTDVKFYKNYSFDIQYITSTVEVQGLATDEDVYAQGDDVSVDLWLENSGEAQDVIVDAVVTEQSSGDVVDGLVLESLDGLTRLASFDDQWDSSGVDPGQYAIEVEVRDTSGNVLDRGMTGFELGIHAGEITSFTATPEYFDIGDSINISLDFSNAGSMNITGTAVIKVQDEAADIIQEFRHDFTDLTSANSISFNDTWDTSGAKEGSYSIVGYVLYDSRSTTPAIVGVSTNHPPYMPDNPSPADDATGVSIDADLSWTGGDPDTSDNVTYNVYFGTNSTPALMETIGPYAANQTSLNYDLNTLAYNTTYYWQVVARDNHGITREGPLWDFSTRVGLSSYNLTVNSTAGGNVTTPGEGTFTRDAGTVVSLVATPDTGYQFVNWTGDVGTIDDVDAATTTITMDGSYNITASFARRVTPVPPGPGPAPRTRYLRVDWEGNITKKPLYSNDRLAVDLLGPSPDGSHSLLLERGTHAPIVGGRTHYLIVIRELEEIPPLPENTEAIVAVNITPEGAVFDRDIFLTLGLNEVPENARNVTMAYYDDVNEVWVPLEYEGVAELTLSAAINRFSVFGVLAELAPTPPPPPAHFVPSGLNIVTSVEKIWEPVTFVTKTGESVTITANVANDGGQEGIYVVELKLNGETVDTETVTLGAGQSREVSFTVSGLDYGQYEVEVAGLSGDFTTSRTITWWLIIVIIMAIGLITWGVVWGTRRRRRASQEEAAQEG